MEAANNNNKPAVKPRLSKMATNSNEEATNNGKPMNIAPKPKIVPPHPPPAKPSIAAKPKTAVKPDFGGQQQQSQQHQQQQQQQQKQPENVKPVSSNVPSKTMESVGKASIQSIPVVNKLKISASDLNRLRYKRDIFQSVDGQAGQQQQLIYDVREDEEQIIKMNEICELLIAGGYFRARIKGLHNFDKVIGGMCWAIQMCNVELDVDVFYRENLSIGRKIALTEKIVTCLQRMKCPFKLEPHQIQGMDCIHIYPVIQWLVKKSLETREQNAHYLRAYATWQYNRIYQKGGGGGEETRIDEGMVDPIKANLTRRYFHPARDQLSNESLRLRTTLLEYCVIGTGAMRRLIASSADDRQGGKESQLTVKGPGDGSKPRTDSDTQAVEGLLSNMTVMDDAGDTGGQLMLKTSIIGRVVGAQGGREEIQRLAEDYERNKGGGGGGVDEVDRKYAKIETKLIEAIEEKLRTLETIEDPTDKLQTIQAKLAQLDEKLAEAEEMERNESEEEKQEKLHLSELLASLRQQKSTFRQSAREEKQKLEAQLARLEREAAARASGENGGDDSQRQRLAAIEAELAESEQKHTTVRRQLADVSKRYMCLQRKFDDIPGRTELTQYQKRFLELYNQLSNKHNETKKFYTLYNTLADERTYLEKEFNLINSVLENFQMAYESGVSVKEDFLRQFNTIIDSIAQNNAGLRTKLTQDRARRDQLEAEHKDLVDYQRHYYQAVKKFKEICKDNEQLMAQLESC